MRVKRIFVFDRTNHNRNESRRDFRRATRPIHRHRADEWEKAPAMGAFGTLVGYTRLSARGVRAFSRRSAERPRTCGYVTDKFSIHRNNADEWEKAPAMGAFGTLVGDTRLSARGVRAFSRRSAERPRICGSATDKLSIHRNNADEWEKAPAMGAFGTLVGDRTRICGSGGHRSIRYTTSAKLFNLYIILYSGAGVKRLRRERKRKLTRKKAARFRILPKAGG